MSIDESTRHQLAVLARRRHARVTEFSQCSSDKLAARGSSRPEGNARVPLYGCGGVGVDRFHARERTTRLKPLSSRSRLELQATS